MRTAVALLVALTAAVPPAAEAQMDFYARLGVTAATRLLRDDILQEIDVRQRLAPAVALGVSLPFTPLYGVGLEATVTSGEFHATEAGGETDLGTLRTGSIMLGLDGPIWRQLRWRAGAGLLTYWPAHEQGIFLQGGSTRFLVGAGLDFRQPVMTRWELMVSGRYDFHRFTTDELVTRGFSGTQGVQRASVSVGLARARQ